MSAGRRAQATGGLYEVADAVAHRLLLEYEDGRRAFPCAAILGELRARLDRVRRELRLPPCRCPYCVRAEERAKVRP